MTSWAVKSNPRHPFHLPQDLVGDVDPPSSESERVKASWHFSGSVLLRPASELCPIPPCGECPKPPGMLHPGTDSDEVPHAQVVVRSRRPRASLGYPRLAPWLVSICFPSFILHSPSPLTLPTWRPFLHATMRGPKPSIATLLRLDLNKPRQLSSISMVHPRTIGPSSRNRVRGFRARAHRIAPLKALPCCPGAVGAISRSDWPRRCCGG